MELGFDADGKRVSKKVYEWTSGDWSNTASYSFVYDGWNLVSEICNRQSEITRKSYLWGLDLSGQRTGKWGQDGGGIAGLIAIRSVSGGSTNIYCRDSVKMSPCNSLEMSP
jgi:hypothetical protein